MELAVIGGIRLFRGALEASYSAKKGKEGHRSFPQRKIYLTNFLSAFNTRNCFMLQEYDTQNYHVNWITSFTAFFKRYFICFHKRSLKLSIVNSWLRNTSFCRNSWFSIWLSNINRQKAMGFFSKLACVFQKGK